MKNNLGGEDFPLFTNMQRSIAHEDRFNAKKKPEQQTSNEMKTEENTQNITKTEA